MIEAQPGHKHCWTSSWVIGWDAECLTCEKHITLDPEYEKAKYVALDALEKWLVIGGRSSNKRLITAAKDYAAKRERFIAQYEPQADPETCPEY